MIFFFLGLKKSLIIDSIFVLTKRTEVSGILIAKDEPMEEYFIFSLAKKLCIPLTQFVNLILKLSLDKRNTSPFFNLFPLTDCYHQNIL